MPTSLRIVGKVNPDSYAIYLKSAPGSIGHRTIVFQITPDTANDLSAYKYVYDSLIELSTFGVIHDHHHQRLPSPVNNFFVFPLSKDSTIPCDMTSLVKPCKLTFKYVFQMLAVNWIRVIYLFLFGSKCNLFFILPHFTALREGRNADYLMGVAVVNNPLFDKFRNLTIDDLVEQTQAVGANLTELENGRNHQINNHANC
jgi:hypothetical protein